VSDAVRRDLNYRQGAKVQEKHRSFELGLLR